ncbi:RagB/SusD domain-containing protein [Neolewinella xylanilytica]|uniref:RagB/SusD domain-containing protein n=1 Tax=Neolewinella xylanilytica TaxID=1514080 RepID=A0A2S6I311_9BACT|nr:RagB/SusD family nutrient uptake outer membrane protein [Neolewinella xylanilytica]PPK85540.1 RagB/SusD domain-containing protein [Neolewinella xylanilytica]
MKSSIIFAGFLLLALSACEIDEQFDPNGPIVSSVLQNASETELDLLVTGIEAGMRTGYTSYVTASGTIARELYIFDADPRNTADLLGKGETVLDANTFYLTGPFTSRYQVVKNVNILLTALENTDVVSEEEKQGYRGFANTIKAYMLSQVLDMLGSNGVRVDVADPENLGPYLSQEEGFTRILELLDEANQQLDDAVFAFVLSDGFAGFNTPETFSLFNRAIAARVATHAGRYADALAYANASFLDLDGDLSTGPQHIFSTNAGDLLNPIYRPPGQSGDQFVVHPRIIADTTAGDLRFDKFRLRPDPTGKDGLNGQYESALYETSTSPIDIIRNEELVLIYAEANINLGNLEEGEAALNIIREAAGIGAYPGPTTQEALIDEMLYQRRYSLWGEGHLMWDLRRYGRLNENFLPIDRPGDDIFTQFPIPLAENA